MNNEGNDIGDRVRLQEAVDGWRKLVKAGLLLPCGVRYRLKFCEVGGNVIFPKVKIPGKHAEGRRLFQGYDVIVVFAGVSDNAGDRRVGGRHFGASVTVDGAFESNRSKIEEVSNPIPEDKKINLTWPIRL